MFVVNLFALLDFALPARCPGCGAIVAKSGLFCTGCWEQLDFLTGEGCATCGIPTVSDGLVCAPCMENRPRHDGVRAAVSYGPVSSKLAIQLKHGRRIGLAKPMGFLMAAHVRDKGSLLVPVPLHRDRVWLRGFNQAVLIARAVQQRTGQTLIPDLLVRSKKTPILGGLGRAQRLKALAGAIKVRPDQQPVIRDRNVLLIDDVYTSGATANACASALKRAGAAKVEVLCWARVVKDDLRVD